MKKYFILLTIIFIADLSYAQTPYQLVFGFGPTLNFDDTAANGYFYIDTLQLNNIWQIGKPNKLVFDSAYSKPNAIITDTISNYPINNYSSFFMTLLKVEGFMIFQFRHKFDTDSLITGGNIEISFDFGTTWGNVIDDTFLNTYDTESFGTYNFYSITDTVNGLGNKPGFSGNSGGWINSEFLIYYQNSSVIPDTFLLRFNFGSDSLNSTKDGWIIDNIAIGASHVGIQNLSTTDILLIPNPTTGVLTFNNSNLNINSVTIYNNIGQNIMEINKPLTKEINLSNLSNGIYFISINRDNGITHHKIVLEK